jgi:hypothetical protein
MNTDNTQLLNDLLVVAPVLVTETIYVKEPTPAEHTARLLAALLDKTPVLPTVTVYETAAEFAARGGLAKIASPRHAYQAQKAQTIKKAKRTRSFKQFVYGTY